MDVLRLHVQRGLADRVDVDEPGQVLSELERCQRRRDDQDLLGLALLDQRDELPEQKNHGLDVEADLLHREVKVPASSQPARRRAERSEISAHGLEVVRAREGDAGVADEMIEAAGQNLARLLGRGADAVCIAHVHLDEVEAAVGVRGL